MVFGKKNKGGSQHILKLLEGNLPELDNSLDTKLVDLTTQ